jgi:hypothetical protein
VLGLIEGQQHVGGLDVAVHETACVGGVERGGNLQDQACSALWVERSPRREHLLEVDPVDEAHRDEKQAVVLAGLVHRDHVRVLDRGGDLRLGLEAVSELGVLGVLGRDQLVGNPPLECELGAAIDDPHPAAGDRAVDPVAGDDRGWAYKARTRRLQHLLHELWLAGGELHGRRLRSRASKYIPRITLPPVRRRHDDGPCSSTTPASKASWVSVWRRACPARRGHRVFQRSAAAERQREQNRRIVTASGTAAEAAQHGVDRWPVPRTGHGAAVRPRARPEHWRRRSHDDDLPRTSAGSNSFEHLHEEGS